jgi:hypothetical protein
MKTNCSTGSRFYLFSNLARLIGSASVARIDFFAREPEISQRTPDSRDAGFHLGFLFQLLAEFLQDSVRHSRYKVGQNRQMVRVQFGYCPATVGKWDNITSIALLAKKLIN